MDAEHLLEQQRALRGTLLDSSRITWRPARDLAAHLLLHLDDTQACWQLAVQWLRDAFDADRVDAGFASPWQAVYRPQAEARRSTRPVPTMTDASIDVTDAGVQGVWASPGIVVFRDVEQERSFGAPMRSNLLALGARNVLATALWHRGAPVGMACADWMERRVDSSDARCSHFQELVTVLGPVMSAARSLQGDSADAPDALGGPRQAGAAAASSPLAELTPAERKVARLAATGMSYKEIARQLNRSFSTVDHQLRSVRTKLGVRSTSRLVRLLSSDQPFAAGASAVPHAASGS
jgi:DNA-binding CsgD family transcriptional regulator